MCRAHQTRSGNQHSLSAWPNMCCMLWTCKPHLQGVPASQTGPVYQILTPIRSSACRTCAAAQVSIQNAVKASGNSAAAAPVLQTVCDDARVFIDELGRHRHEVRVRRIVYRAARCGGASRDALSADAGPALACARAAVCLPGCLRAQADWAAMTHILRRQQGAGLSASRAQSCSTATGWGCHGRASTAANACSAAA